MPDQELKVTTPREREIHAERWFDAPRERVFKAFTDPELISRWWGPRGHTTRVVEMDARAGGTWRFVSATEDGGEFGFGGEFREVSEPDRIVWTFTWDDNPGEPSTETVTFTEQDGGTLVRSVSVFASEKDRDDMLATGMEAGMRETYERLAELLAKGEAA